LSSIFLLSNIQVTPAAANLMAESIY